VRLDGAKIEGAVWTTRRVCQLGSSGAHCIEGEASYKLPSGVSAPGENSAK